MVEHEIIEARTLSTREVYRLMTDLVAPRPIAWISTEDEHGHRNLAPFSYFQGVCSRPPMVVVSFAWGADGRPKDTLRNILATAEFTINHVGSPLGEPMNATSGEYPADVSEWDIASHEGQPLRAAPSRFVRPPRVEAAKAALECRLVHALPLGTGAKGKPSSTMVVGEVVAFSLEAGLVARDAAGHLLAIDPAQLASIGRLGGIAYTETDHRFDMPRPRVDAKGRTWTTS